MAIVEIPIKLTLEELTVIACAVEAHEQRIQMLLGGAAYTPIHRDVLIKIRQACRG